MQRSFVAAATAVLCLLAGNVAAGPPRERIVDLTYAFDANSIYWPTEEKGFSLSSEHAGVTEKGYYYASNVFAAPEHGGTHVDAPIHFWATGASVDAIPLDHLIGSALLVDVRDAVRANRDHEISVADLQAWEKTHGPISAGSIVLLRTGFGEYWPDRRRYLGTDERGVEAVAKLHFPGLAPHAAEWLADTRKIHAVGIDTASIDHGQSTLFGSHVALFSRGVPAFENVANLDRLPAKGFTVIALPMKIAGGSGGPLRIIAMIDR